MTLETGEEYELDLGYLSPVEFVTGIQARLSNLGYCQDEPSGSLDDDTRDAIRRFQKAQGLPETGEATSRPKTPCSPRIWASVGSSGPYSSYKYLISCL